MTDSSELSYTKQFFNPPRQYCSKDKNSVYVYTDEIILAVNVALATGRPLLVRGVSGSGKSSLAENAADWLNWRYYKRVITSRTQASDLLYEIDWLKRLHDAQSQRLLDDYKCYIIPGELWWAFNNKSAKIRESLTDPDILGKDSTARAVVLLDEIDKADPDMPNSLLEPLGSLKFKVPEINMNVSTTREIAPLMVITTNEERELPKAFLRRCVELNLKLPKRPQMIDIAQIHFPEMAKDKIEGSLKALLGNEQEAKTDHGISPAELLDMIRACQELNVKSGTLDWNALVNMTVWKHGRSKDQSL